MNKPNVQDLVSGLIVHEQKLLLVRNCKEHLKDSSHPIRLEPFGGKIEATDATHEAALHREAQEELQITLLRIGSRIATAKTVSQEGHYIAHMYQCFTDADPTTITTHEPNKLNGVVWASAADLLHWQTLPPENCILVPNLKTTLAKIQTLLI